MNGDARQGRRKARRRSPVGTIGGLVGELFLTVAVIAALFVVYLLWGTGIQTAAAQDDLRGQLNFGGSQAQTAQPPLPDELKEGDAYGIIRIPRFGKGWDWVMVEGVKGDDLKDGPGHYPDSADPGGLGNFSLAGHRSGHGEPFAKFPELRVGDIVEVQTVVGTFVYRLDDAPDGDPDGNKITTADTWVIAPVPRGSDTTVPTERRITLTTCWPRFGSSYRMYATGVLIDVKER